MIGQIPVPPMLDRNTDRLYVLGKAAGPSCLQLVSILMQYNTFIDEVGARIVTLNADQWGEFVKQADDHLKLVGHVIAKCEHEVKTIYSVVENL